MALEPSTLSRWQFYYASELRGLRFFTGLLFRGTPKALMADQTLQVAQEASHVYLWGTLIEDHGESLPEGILALQDHLAARAPEVKGPVGNLALAAVVEEMALAEYRQRLVRKTYFCSCEKDVLEEIVQDESWHVGHLQAQASKIDPTGQEWAKGRLKVRQVAEQLRLEVGPDGAAGSLFRGASPTEKVH